MTKPLHVLLIEDSDDDAHFILRELKNGGYAVTSERVETAPALQSALARCEWELVLSDYALPKFSGEAALRMVREHAPDLPFIFVSGTIGEDVAVAAMRAGAHDYVMKGNLARLVPAIDRELRDAVERSQRREAERQMRMSEHKYRHLFRSMSDAALLVAEETDRIIDVNEQAEVIFGRTREAMLGVTSTALCPTLHRPFTTEPGAPGGDASPASAEHLVERPDGVVTPVHVGTSEVQLYGHPCRLVLLRDISKRKQAETALRNVLRHARTIVMNGTVSAPDDWTPSAPGWSAGDFHWQLQFQDADAAEEVLPLGLAPGADCAPAWEAALHADDRTRLVAAATAAFGAHATAWQQEFRSLDRHGRVHWFTQAASIEEFGPGRWRITTVNTDITERVRAEEALRTSEERLSTIFQLSPTPICIVRAADSHFIEVNEAFVTGTGYTRDEIIGRTPSDLALWFVPEERDAITREVDVHGTAIAFKLRGRRKSGEVGVGLCSMTRILLNGEPHLLSLIQDITRLEHAEEARRESDQRFRQVTENIDEVFWLTDAAKQRLIYVSPAYQCLWGRSCESVYADPASWLDAVHPDDRERVRAALPQQAAGHYDVDYRVVRPDKSVRWIHERAFPIRNDQGEVYRIAGVASDLTVRRQLEEQFRQSQKMEAIGLLAGGIAHDFNNLLTVIQMQSSLLLAEPFEPAATHEGIQNIMDAAKRAANLTRQLLTFSRRQTHAARHLDLGEVLGGMTKMLRRVLGEDISLESRFAPETASVHADPGMMEQVLMNLAVNARDAMPTGGRLTIALETIIRDASSPGTHPSARAGRFVRLSVSDTGCGMTADVQARIFEPFFTTKEVGKGTGLGLATVFGIVEQHHGWIEVESRVGAGTTFRVYLPALDTAQTGAREEPVVALRGGTETLLLVEDEAMVRAVAASALRQHGYQVLEAGTAAEALRRWRESLRPIDLLVTDLVMPGGVSGKGLAEQLLRLQPNLPVIYTTGHGTAIVTRQLNLERGVNYLEKPYSFEDLAAIIRRRLEKRRGSPPPFAVTTNGTPPSRFPAA